VTVTDPPADAAGTDADASAAETTNSGGDSPGLGAFADDGADASTGADADPADGETVQFTGTVVQAGNPVVLDDGTETRSVETEADLRLGEEVTVRGPIHDGRIDADEVY
jgi:replication factor A1